MSGMTTDEEERQYNVISSKVAEVTLESDSFTESAVVERSRRKKRMGRKPRKMDIDPAPCVARCKTSSSHTHMEWDRNSCDSDSSLSTSSSRGKEADDEQSDWVGYNTLPPSTSQEIPPFERRLRHHMRRPSSSSSSLHRKLERFSKDATAEKLVLDTSAKARDNTNTLQFNRLLQHYKLEITKRNRGTVVISKKATG